MRRARAAGAAAASPLAGRELASLSFAVVDVETTGTSPLYGDRVTEIAVVQVRDGAIVDRFETLVNPGRHISSFITQLTGITNAMVRDARPFHEHRAEIMRRLEGHVFVAHNVGFDARFVNSETTLAWLALSDTLAHDECDRIVRAERAILEGPQLCTVRLARRLLPHLPRRSLDHVAHHYGIAFDARHRALGDAEVTARVLLRLLDAAADRGCHTWDDLEALLAAGTGGARRRRGAMPRSTWGEEGA